MARIKSSLFLFSLIAFGVFASPSAQAGQDVPSSHVKEIPAPLGVDEVPAGHVKQLPAPGLLPGKLPFNIDSQKTGAAQAIRVVSEEQMSREDHDLVADAQSSIEERAGFQNMEFAGTGWTYHELVCPALPNHMFLRFTRDDGTRQMSMFSAAIPRNGNGRVHIIPIVRRGYSLFSPAPIGAMTIAAFNRIRAEEEAGASADWLGTGLCYAALAGANPQVGEMTLGEGKETPAIFPPTLTITAQGGAVIRFADVAAAPKPMQWTMIFGPNGKLLKAEHGPAYVEHFEKSKAVPADPGNAKR